MEHASDDRGTSTRRMMINIRAKAEDRALIDQAANLQGKSRSDFMLEASLRAAEDALLDRTLLRVDAETYALFLQRLDAPPRPNDALRRLLATKAPWEKGRLISADWRNRRSSTLSMIWVISTAASLCLTTGCGAGRWPIS